MDALSSAVYVHAPTALGQACGHRPSARHAPFDQDLADRVHRLCGQSLRQASRFIHLAAAGALDTARRAQLPDTAGLYLATGLGDQVTPARVFSRTHLHPGAVSPFDFVNMNSNTAAYHVARLAGLRGPNLTITQGLLSFEWALRLALEAMAGGLAYALVGGVDERAASRAELARRYRPGRGQVPGEGSGWLALSAEPARGRLIAMYWLTSPRKADWQALRERLAGLAARRPVQVSDGPRVPKPSIAALLDGLRQATPRPYLMDCGSYPTAAAFGLAQALQDGGPEGALLLHVSTDGRARFVLTVCEIAEAS